MTRGPRAPFAHSYVQEQLFEDSRQAAIDQLLGVDRRLESLSARSRPRSVSSGPDDSALELRLFVGTWNVNGKSSSVSVSDLKRWLSAVEGDGDPPQLYAIGFQEFVDLNAQNLLRDDVAKRRECQARVEAALRELHGEDFVAVQVFGTANMAPPTWHRPHGTAHASNVCARP